MKPDDDDKKVPLGQRLMDSPLILLGIGLLVIFAFYTGWGFYEILTLSKSLLP